MHSLCAVSTITCNNRFLHKRTNTFLLLVFGSTKYKITNCSFNTSLWEKYQNSSPSTILEDLQLSAVKLCSIKLGDGILHVTAGCKLNHPVYKHKHYLGPDSEDMNQVSSLTKRRNTRPSFLLGLWASTKVTSPAFLIRSFRSCFKT